MISLDGTTVRVWRSVAYIAHGPHGFAKAEKCGAGQVSESVRWGSGLGRKGAAAYGLH